MSICNIKYWHDFGKLQFGCNGSDKCWACRLSKKLNRIKQRKQKKRFSKQRRQNDKSIIDEYI